MRASTPLPAGLGPFFSTADAIREGVSPKRLRSPSLDSPFSGARAIGVEAGAGDRFEHRRRELIALCRAFAVIAPPLYCFSGRTAAELYGIPLPARLAGDRALDVSVPSPSRPPRRAGVRGHHVADWRVRTVLGMPLTPPAIAWAQLAPLLTLDELVIAGDVLVRRKRPLATLELLGEAAATARRGGTRARVAMRDIRCGTDSPPESECRLALVRGGLREPIVGHTVFHDGYFVGTPDLAYVEEKVAIEYQGSVHWEDRAVFEDDIVRRELFERAGWKVILVTAARLRNPAWLVAEVRVILSERRLTI